MVKWSALVGDIPHTVTLHRSGGHTGPSVYEGETEDTEPYRIIRCIGCGFVHVLPLPSESEMEAYYRDVFYSGSKPDYLDRYLADQAWWTQTHRAVLTPFLAPGMSFLDVGAGPGIGMDVAMSLGALTFGIELDSTMVRRGRQRGHAMYHGSFRDISPGLWGQMDVVYGWEVLEHVVSPSDFLELAHRVLVPKGRLILEVPNDFSPLQRAAMKKLGIAQPWWVAPPEHLSYFNKNSLRVLLKTNGFEILDLRGTYPMERFLLDGDVYLGDDVIGRACHSLRMQRELSAYRDTDGASDDMLNRYRREMIQGDIGREIICVAQAI